MMASCSAALSVDSAASYRSKVSISIACSSGDDAAMTLCVVERRRRRSGRHAAQFVSNPVHHGLPQIRLERAFPPGLEAPDPPKRIEERFLNKVVGIGRASRPARQAAAGPALERFQVAGEELVERRGVAGVGPIEQVEGRVGVRRRRVRAGGRSGGPDFRQRARF